MRINHLMMCSKCKGKQTRLNDYEFDIRCDYCVNTGYEIVSIYKLIFLTIFGGKL